MAFWSSGCAAPLLVEIAVVVVPLQNMSLMLVRHSKAMFIALDHYCDPKKKK
jgi:hypothetical protein